MCMYVCLLSQDNAVLGKVNCDHESKCGLTAVVSHVMCWYHCVCVESLCQNMFHINKYPTIKLLRNGQVTVPYSTSNRGIVQYQ